MFTILPDLESVRCFVSVATQGSFREAATLVALSPSALSQRIANLERIIGSSLFSRTTRRVVLTEAGAKALPIARRLLKEAQSFDAAVRSRTSRLPFDLTIATRFELGLSWLTPALSTLARNRPERRIHLSFGDSQDMLARVSRGTVDAAITSSRTISSDMRYEILHVEDYVFVAKPALLRQQPLVKPHDATTHTLLDISPELPLFRYFLDGFGTTEPWRFARVDYLGTIGAIRMRAIEGAGIAVLPHYFVAADLAKKKLTQVQKRVSIKPDAFRLLWRADHAREDEHRQLAKELRSIPLR